MAEPAYLVVGSKWRNEGGTYRDVFSHGCAVL